MNPKNEKWVQLFILLTVVSWSAICLISAQDAETLQKITVAIQLMNAVFSLSKNVIL